MNRARACALIAVAGIGFTCVQNGSAQDHPTAVLVVVGPDSVTIEGEPIDWNTLPARLEAVPQRETVVLQLAVSTDEITLAQLKTARARLTELGVDLGFKSVQYIGKRTAEVRATTPTLEAVDVSLAPDAEFQSIQQALDALEPGGLLRIGPGRYEEQITIRRPIRIVGAGWEQTTIVGPEWRRPSEELFRSFQERLSAARSDEERQSIEAEARQWMEEYGASLNTPVVQILGADGVSIEGVKCSLPGTPRKNGGLPGVCVMRILDSRAELKDCAVVGSPGNGIEVGDGGRFEISRCLVSAVWNTGIAVGNVESATIADCDVRNCYHRCLTLGTGDAPCVVRGCRISGAAWHGIRYDGSSPTIEHNVISGNARSGIYASGSTRAVVRNNLFYGNEMNGISCWFDNRDRIERNTFAANQREALAILGASEPTVERNILFDSPVAVHVGFISGGGERNEPRETRHIDGNWFWRTEQCVVVSKPDPDGGEAALQVHAAADEGEGNVEADPSFSADGYSLTEDSAAGMAEVGAGDVLDRESPWPLQPEEEAIIPRNATRDWNAWRRPE